MQLPYKNQGVRKMAKIIKMTDHIQCEPIKIEIFGDEYRVHQATGDLLNHLKTIRNIAEENIKELKRRETSMSEEEKAINALDISINQIEYDIDIEEATIACYLGESALESIKNKYKIAMGEEISYIFLKQLSAMVSSLANTGEYNPQQDDGVEEKGNFQK